MVSWLHSWLYMYYCAKGVFLLHHMLFWLGHATCVEGLTYGGKVLSDHTQRCTGLLAQKQFVRVTCHIHDFSSFKGFSRW